MNFRLKTKVEGDVEAKSPWKIKCHDVFVMIHSRYPTVTPVEAGEIVKYAFPFVKRQNYHTKRGISESYYYRMRLRAEDNDSEQFSCQNDESNIDDHDSATISRLEKKIKANEENLKSKDDRIKELSTRYSKSVEKITTLQKQKRTLCQVINDLEEEKLKQRKLGVDTNNGDACTGTVHSSVAAHVTFIPEDQLLPHSDSGYNVDVGYGSYGTCKLKMWKNIPVCVKTMHKAAELSDVEKEVAAMCALQQSLFVPVLLGANLKYPPFYIVTKFHSVKVDSSVTLSKAIHCSTIKRCKWGKILVRCAEAVKSVHNLGFLHNDLHLKNIIIDTLGGHVHPVIIDYGKACKVGYGRCRNIADFENYTKQHPWIAPETICGEHQESEASDIYSFGYIMDKVDCKIGCSNLAKLVSECRSSKSSRPTIEKVIQSLQLICDSLT